MKKLLVSYLLISTLIFIGVTFFNAQQSLAQDNTVMKGTDVNLTSKDCGRDGRCFNKTTDECKQYCGDYELNDFVLLGIKLTKIMLGLVGTLAFGAFIYGGVMFLISAGDSDKVKNGKSAMTNAVIGLVVVFSSYLIIQFTLQTLGYLKPDTATPTDTANFGNQTWNEAPPTPKN